MIDNITDKFSDKMIIDDIIVNDGEVKHSKAHDNAAPHGRLFEVLGNTADGKHRLLKEIACNIVVVGGAINALDSIIDWDLYTKKDDNGNPISRETWYPQTIEELHNIDTAKPPWNTAVTGLPKICLFGVGIGGSGLDFGSYRAPSIIQKDIMEPIPIRYGVSNPSPIDATVNHVTNDSNVYCMMVPDNNEDNPRFGWYLKKFTSVTPVSTVAKNSIDGENDAGNPITGNTDISTSEGNIGYETYVEIQIELDDDDVIEYFNEAGLNRNQARYNTIGFYTGNRILDAYTEGENVYDEFKNVRLYSVINFNNRDVSLKNRATYIYRIYSLV